MNTDPDSTIAQYRKLVAEYPSSVYAERVRPKLAYLDSQKHAGEASKDSLATHDQKKNPDKEFRDESPLGKGKRLNPEEPDQIPKSPRLLKETPRDTTGRTLQ
jgi:hypothetical protein